MFFATRQKKETNVKTMRFFGLLICSNSYIIYMELFYGVCPKQKLLQIVTLEEKKYNGCVILVKVMVGLMSNPRIMKNTHTHTHT